MIKNVLDQAHEHLPTANVLLCFTSALQLWLATDVLYKNLFPAAWGVPSQTHPPLLPCTADLNPAASAY